MQEPANQNVPFWGIDRKPESRPGVPMEQDPPRHVDTAHWNLPERQPLPGFPVYKRVGLAQLTPVFGTAQPPHGLSGLLRRAAYSVPDHKPVHWAILLVADRVDVIESRIAIGRAVTLVGMAGGAVAALLHSRKQNGHARAA